MKLHRTAAVSVLAIAALGVATGTAYAEPGPPPAPGAIHYQTQSAR
ncbi:ammonium transporter, partial [Rhodococcus hoagii]|nr:ammonium transporter [Prescottella equi]